LILNLGDRPVVEIGPGLGALTRPLLSKGATVVAREHDRGLAAALRDWPEAAPGGRLRVTEADALGIDLIRDLGPGPFTLCGNLPYNISTPLIFWSLAQAEAAPEAVFTLQREMAERLSAAPGGRDYGRLAVTVALGHLAEVLMDIPPAAFRPRPKVHSRVVRLKAIREVTSNLRSAVGRLTAAAFHARRKTLINNLGPVYGRERALGALSGAGIDPKARPETLGPSLFRDLAEALELSGGGSSDGAKAPGEAPSEGEA
jgi:16S rRNA (adenine1518-N6/adenine1519-N6)-dimethyltransferase